METIDILVQLEKELQAAETRASRERLNLLLSNEFIEIGSSGVIRDKVQTIDLLLNSKPSETRIQAKGFRLNVLAVETMQLIYTTIEVFSTSKARNCIRSSIWKLHGANWEMIFHQATVLSTISNPEKQ